MSKESRLLSWLLRHGASDAGLDMDEAGWADVDQVLAVSGMDRAALQQAVERNDKGRLQLEGDRIRACQGHSAANMPVTVAALEASWRMLEPSGSLWHGTTVAALAGIAERGIEPSARTHVHLAETRDSKVGKRFRVDVLLEVSASCLEVSGVRTFLAPNGVVLARRIPAHCIAAVHAVSAPQPVVDRACRDGGLPVAVR